MQPAAWKTTIPAVAAMGRPYRLHPKASADFGLRKEIDFPV